MTHFGLSNSCGKCYFGKKRNMRSPWFVNPTTNENLIDSRMSYSGGRCTLGNKTDMGTPIYKP